LLLTRAFALSLAGKITSGHSLRSGMLSNRLTF